MFCQWAGDPIIWSLFSTCLDTIGINSQTAQENLRLVVSCSQLVAAVIGACLVDVVGCRPLLIVANAMFAILFLGLTIATSADAKSGSIHTAIAILVLLWLFLIVFAVGITPLQVLYPVEILSFDIRAKGLAISGLSVAAAGLPN